MELQHWQAQFENWLKTIINIRTRRMTCVIFAVSGLRHRNWRQMTMSICAVILTACYFHDIVSLAKIIRNGSVLQSSAAEETRRLLREEFVQFPAEKN